MSRQQNKYWFKRRRYVWGWVPITWQGWLSVILFIIIILAAAFQLPAKPAQPTTEQLVSYLAIVGLDILGLLAISFAKGPRPHWRWGTKPTDDPDEDY